MIVVADTSPLNYLILIGHIDVLKDSTATSLSLQPYRMSYSLPQHLPR